MPSVFENSLRCLRCHVLNGNRQIRLLSTNSSNLMEIKSNKNQLENEIVSAKTDELTISEGFKEMLDRTLKKPIRLIDKQITLKEIIFGTDSVYQLYYLIDFFHKDFTHHSLLYFIKKLKMLLPEERITFEMPLKIKGHLTKLLIKCSPSFEAHECLTTFFNLNLLGFNLNDFAYHAAMQILKFHVNEFDLDDLIKIKKLLNELKGEEMKISNEYVEILEKSLTIAVELKLADISQINTANRLIRYFGNDLSKNNLERVRQYIRDYNYHFRVLKKFKKILHLKKQSKIINA